MELKQWMKRDRWTSVALAKEIGVSNSTIGNVRSKTYKPSLLLAKAIESFTEGHVSLKDLGVEKR